MCLQVPVPPCLSRPNPKLSIFCSLVCINYSHSKRVIMDYTRCKILFPINALVIRKTLEVPLSFTLNWEYFVKENLIEQFRHAVVEEKQVFYSKILKLDVSVADEPFPFDINMFNEESQLVIS